MPPATPSLLPQAPAVVAGHGRAALLTGDGELLLLSAAAARAQIAAAGAPLVVHAPATLRRLGIAGPLPCLDLLELFAFVLPARHVPPTPGGLAAAVGLPAPRSVEQAAALLPDIAERLLLRLAAEAGAPQNRDAAGTAAWMGRSRWSWTGLVLAALRQPAARPSIDGLRVWLRLPEWEDEAPPPPSGSQPVAAAEARSRLAQMLGPAAEQRPGQSDYASAAARAFAPREARGDPVLVLAEAGTGTGKTLGYIAPASLWAERNGGSVWLSTFTRHLQRQIDAELTRLFPDPAERRRRVVVRKGRENYLCLLNFQDQVGTPFGTSPIASALVARWALATADGDVAGGDLPGWFGELFGPHLLPAIADRRGECIHGACPHYKTCFVEHTVRRARSAQLVVANHALVMAQAAWGGLDDNLVPTRYVFDEGHHVFDAADGAFAAELSGVEGAELRRWLLGAEGGRSRARGLRRRLDDLLAVHPELEPPLLAALQAARCLPGQGWPSRLAEEQGETGPFEAVLRLIRRQVLARCQGEAEGNTLECDLAPLLPGIAEAAEVLGRALHRIGEPLCTLERRLRALLEDEAATLETQQRQRIEAARRSIARRAILRLEAWGGMLRALLDPPAEPGTRPQHVYSFRLERRGGADRDAGMQRHWLDPTVPFAGTLAAPAHGLLITSATLRDTGEADAESAWEAAEARVGAVHLPSPALRVAVASPFDYAAQTRAFVVTDVGFAIEELAGAYKALFLASHGGGLGLFTAIRRLQAVHARIAPALEGAGIPLLAQHVDAMDNATLVDVFRAELDSCLLGTDAMRDGVDVPGRALRLVVFERVPWPRPDILHRERRIHLSGGDPKGYDDSKARLRLRQAFGRLVRSETDRGVFVLLDRRTPSRLLSAFPPGVAVRRVGLAEAVGAVQAFLRPASLSQR